MIRHLLKLVWNRKKMNALIMAEIFLAFLVVFAVICTALTMSDRWAYPTGDPRGAGGNTLGFAFDDVWVIGIEVQRDLLGAQVEGAALRETGHRLLQDLKTAPNIAAVASANTPPYMSSTNTGGFRRTGGNEYATIVNDMVSDDFAAVMGMTVRRGRWFGRQDDAATYPPVVIDADAAREMFGEEDPIGKTIEAGADTFRVIGVVDDFRKDGELAEAMPMMFRRFTGKEAIENMVVRVKPGTPAEFEAVLAARLQSVGPQLSYRIRKMDDMRRLALRLRFVPIVAGAVVALFLISMVALGLTGVLWQDVTKRTREIGLRRAIGASSAAVMRQVIAEVMLLTTIAVAAAGILIAQLPILGAFGWMSRQAFVIGIVAALASIYALTVLCSMYPSWLASRLMPAEALRHE